MRTGLAEKTQPPQAEETNLRQNPAATSAPGQMRRPSCSLALEAKASTAQQVRASAQQSGDGDLFPNEKTPTSWPCISRLPEACVCLCLFLLLPWTISVFCLSAGCCKPGTGKRQGRLRLWRGAQQGPSRFPHGPRLLTPFCSLTTSRAPSSTEPPPGRKEAFCCIITIVDTIS